MVVSLAVKKIYKKDPFENTHIEVFKSNPKILNCICRLQLLLLHHLVLNKGSTK